MENRINKELIKLFHLSLNEQGYSFQYSVINEILKYSNGISPFGISSSWNVAVTEFPVNINGKDIHIDFILKNSEKPVYIVAECKRANPSLSNWCFAKSPYIHINQKGNYKIIFEKIINKWSSKISSEAFIMETTQNAFHIMLEIKSNKKGDKNSKGRGEFNLSVSQIIRGMNGFSNFMFTNQLINEKEWAILIPVIFTTANLYVSNVKLNHANLIDGNIDISKIKLNNKNWLWYNYHQSISLKHSIPQNKKYKSLHEILDSEYARSIAVVNSNYIVNFLEEMGELVSYGLQI